MSTNPGDLERVNESFRRIYRGSRDGIVYTSVDGNVLAVNPAFAALLGYREDELVGVAYATLSPECWTGLEHSMSRHPGAHETSPLFEKEYRRRDGSLVPVEVWLLVERDGAGEPVGRWSFVRDISQRKAAERRLRRSEQLFSSAFHSSPDAMIVSSLDEGRIVDVNSGFTDITGWITDQVVGKTVTEIELWEDPDYRERKVQALRDGSSFEVNETTIRRRDGEHRQVSVSASVIDVDGRPCVFSVARDITERSRLERELEQARKMEVVGQLTGGIAHDFNNMLATVLGFSELARGRLDKLTPEQLGDYFDQIIGACERGRELIAQLMSFSRMGGGDGADAIEPAAPVAEVTKLLETILPASIELELHIEEDLPLIGMDPVHVHQLIMNLGVNARDAMAGKGRIEIRLARRTLAPRECTACHQTLAGEYVSLSVRDSGSGIEPRMLNQIFDPFFTTKSLGRGTGMGLAVVHSLVHSHGGHVLVESSPQNGTCIELLLPPQARPNSERSSLIEETEPSPAGPPSRLLVVDDEPALRRFMKALLSADGHLVHVAADGVEALELLTADPGAVDLLVTDQTMPRMTGVELVREAHSLRPDLPVVLLTGHSEEVDEQRAPSLGIDRFLYKPTSAKDLIGAVRGLLNERRQAPESGTRRPSALPASESP